MQRTQPDVDINRRIQYGGAQSQTPRAQIRKKNLVFEGIPDMPDRQVAEYIVTMCSALDIIAYSSDIESILRMTRRDGSKKPGPVLASFDQLHIRSAILRNKYKLAEIEKYSSLFINLDEPIETRRAKALFRRIGYKARQDGKTVVQRDDWISIDDVQYKINDLTKIPRPTKSTLKQLPIQQTLQMTKTTTHPTQALDRRTQQLHSGKKMLKLN